MEARVRLTSVSLVELNLRSVLVAVYFEDDCDIAVWLVKVWLKAFMLLRLNYKASMRISTSLYISLGVRLH